jgi:hypothetical protein
MNLCKTLQKSLLSYFTKIRYSRGYDIGSCRKQRTRFQSRFIRDISVTLRLQLLLFNVL